MKTDLTLRSTLSNTSWMVRGAAALAVAPLMFTLALALRPNAQVPAAAPAIQHAVPAARTSPNVPISGTGSAYDGGHYGSFTPAVRTSPNVPISGTGSAYDGGHYGSFTPAAHTSPNVPISGTGSAYNGR
jgi:hypothetical protein